MLRNRAISILYSREIFTSPFECISRHHSPFLNTNYSKRCLTGRHESGRLTSMAVTDVFSPAYSTTATHRVAPLSLEEARRLVGSLNERERLYLSNAITELSSAAGTEETGEKPSTRQLQLVLIEAALPFVGFGFLDNFIMILAGEYIDLTIGVTLGISTMAAAALGNLVSDLFGLSLADSVEALCRKLGLPNPRLTPPQMKHNSVRWMQRLGRVVGITIGCIVGMAPLYWFDDPHSDSEHCSNKTD